MSSPKLETNEPPPTAVKVCERQVPDWVNEENFVDVLRDNNPGFKKILKFDTGLTGGAGENYASIIVRIKVKFELEDGSTKDIAYMLKTVPQSEQGAMMVKMMGIFPKETAMYSTYLPEFEQIYRDAGENVNFGPKFYSLKKDPGSDYVLLEDLSPRGFKNVNRLEGLDKDHTESVLRILAKLHAASAVRYETKGGYSESFIKGMISEETRPAIETLFNSLHGIFLECLAKSETCAKYLPTVKKSLSESVDLLIKLGRADLNEFNVINHGDLWANNIMFRHSDEGKREETILVDFQISRYGSPVMDLLYFLLSSTSLDIKLSQFDYFIKYYHEHLVDNLELLKYSKKVPTLKYLRMEILKHSYFALQTITGVMAALLLDPSEDANIDSFMNDMDFKRQMYLSPRYVKHIEAIIPWLDMRGMLE